MVNPEDVAQFYSLPFEEWMYGNIHGSACETEGNEDWSNVCAVIVVVELCAMNWSLLGRSAVGLESWLFGFSWYIGRSLVLVAKLWAMYEGLRHAWELGFRCLVIETDNNEVASICNGSSVALAQSALVVVIHDLQQRDCDGGRNSSVQPLQLSNDVEELILEDDD
ncbi:hypothetical protein V6N12_064973 [Hibiscus sabdariffa]|uniref:RNase H type-1 domain-containing protein n=1 Tax=Hibiscus sabdariffa TaxID=183260 RepID=A0ABR2G7C1_9ROSI